MAEAIVKIEDVESALRNTRYGQKTIWNVIASDGRRYGTWLAELGQKAATLRGQAVRIEYEYRQTKDKNDPDKVYDNYDLKALEASAFSPTPETTGNTQEAVRQAPMAAQSLSNKDSSIARAVALKAAVELAAGGVIEDPTPDGLLTVSEVFTDWLLTGEGSPKAQVVPIVNRDTGDETDDPEIYGQDGELVKF